MDRKELIEYRTSNTKHFLKKDGTIDVEIYDENIHYLKDGKYEEIDNTLVENKNGYTNNSNSFKVQFNENSTDNLINLSSDDNTLSMSFKDIDNLKLSKKKLPKPKKTSNLNLKDEIRYKNIYKNIDVKYEIKSNQLKESIILNEIPEQDNITFKIKTKMDLKINKDNTISCKYKRKNKFIIEKPFMFDSNNEISNNVIYNLEKTSDGYEITITPDKEWLNDKSRVYPVIIDPTITDQNDNNTVLDTYIYNGDDKIEVYNQDILRAGVATINGKNVACRTLLKFNLKPIPPSHTLVDAKLNLLGYADTNCDNVNNNSLLAVHEVTQDWTEKTAKWSNMNNKYNSKLENYFFARRSPAKITNNTISITPDYAVVNITDLVNKWYNNPNSNFGLMIKAYDETYDSKIKCGEFYSKDNKLNGDSKPKPILTLSYRNFNGLEEYLSYTSQSHDLGSSHINNFNGNLTSTFDVANTIGGPLPANMYLVYNTTDVVAENKIDYGYGLGIKPNLIQTITLEENEIIKYLDEDGTIHYFYKKDNIYKDEDGLGLTIELINNNYVMKDKDSNTNKFIKHSNNIYYLEQITDTNNKSIKITYDTNNKITKVTDASNNEITITYNTNKISFISPYKITVVNLTDNKITSIEELGDTLTISYNSNNLIEKITNSNGLSTKYDYLNDLTYKVSKVTEYSKLDTEGNYLEFTYNLKSTTIKDRKGQINTYVFNHFGNVETTSNLDKNIDLSNAYGKSYTYGDRDTAAVNKIVLDSSLIKHVDNLIDSSSFEEGKTIFTSSSSNISCTLDTDSHYGNKALKIKSNDKISSISMSKAVVKGKNYTFSTYVKNTVPLELSLSYGNVESKIEINKLNTEYSRYDVTIDYPTTATSDLTIKIKPLDVGTILIDDIQLEEGEVANYYNLMSNGSFKNGLTGYNISTVKRTLVQGSWKNVDAPLSAEIVTLNNAKVLKCKNNPLLNTILTKAFNISGKKGDVFELSFWYKNEGISRDARTYTFAKFNYTKSIEDTNNGEEAVLTDYNNDWHFFSKKFTAKEDYDNLTFTLNNYFNINDFYITNISLFKDLESYSYVYDDEGNLISSTDLSKETSQFAYNSNNQLIQTTTPKGANYKFEYDDNVTDRLIRAVSPSGITNAIDYDGFNNPIKTTVNNTQAFDDIIDTIYYIRARGTDDYVYINADKTLRIKQCECSHDKFNVLLQPNNRIKLQYSIMSNYYLKDNNGALKIEYGDNNDLFELLKHSNKSYSIRSVSSNLAITVNTNKSLSLTAYSETNENQQFIFERMESSLFIESSAKYTDDGRFIKSVKDSIGNITTYDIDSTSGLTNSITDPNGNSAFYTYDDKYRITNINKSNQKVDYEYDTNNNLTKIIHGTKNYIFNYDEFNNTSSVKINNRTLVNNYYEPNNGNKIKIKYGNN